MPARDIGHGALMCAEHAAKYRVYLCRTCGCRVITSLPGLDETCPTCLVRRRLDAMTAAELSTLDDFITRGEGMAAMSWCRRALQPPVRFEDAEYFVELRRRALGLPRERSAPVPTAEALVATLGPKKPSEIVASWDGDTHGWFVCLDAIVAGSRVPLHTFRDEAGDLRLFNGTVPPWPEKEQATALGTDVAKRLGVPFRFDSSDGPVGG